MASIMNPAMNATPTCEPADIVVRRCVSALTSNPHSLLSIYKKKSLWGSIDYAAGI